MWLLLLLLLSATSVLGQRTPVKIWMTFAPLAKQQATSVPVVEQRTSAPEARQATSVPRPTWMSFAPRIEHTEAPEVPQSMVTAEVANAVDAAVAISVVMSSGTGAGDAAQLALVADALCAPRATPPLLLHPLQVFGIGALHDDIHLGIVVWNSVFFAGFCVVSYLVVLAVSWHKHCCRQQQKLFFAWRKDYETRGWVRFPALQCLLFLLLYQGTCLSAFKLLVNGKPWEQVLGAVCVVFLWGMPLLGGYFVLVCDVHAKGKAVFYEPLPEKDVEICGVKAANMHWLMGPGEWVSHRDFWVARHIALLTSYKEQYSWGLMLEYAAMALLAACNSPETTSLEVCGHMKLASAAVCFIFFCIYSKLQMHVRLLDNVLMSGRMLCQTVASGLMTVGFYTGNRSLFRASEVFLILTVVALLLKGLIEFVHVVLVFATSRRQKLEEAFREQKVLSAAAYSIDISEDNEVEMEAVEDPQPLVPLLQLEKIEKNEEKGVQGVERPVRKARGGGDAVGMVALLDAMLPTDTPRETTPSNSPSPCTTPVPNLVPGLASPATTESSPLRSRNFIVFDTPLSARSISPPNRRKARPHSVVARRPPCNTSFGSASNPRFTTPPIRSLALQHNSSVERFPQL